MRSKIKLDLQNTINSMGLEALKEAMWDNIGYFSIEAPNKFGQLGKLEYHFGTECLVLKLTVGSKKVLNPTRDNCKEFYISYTDRDAYSAFTNLLKQELQVLLVA